MDAKRAARIQALAGTQAFTELAAELQEAERRYWDRHIAQVKLGAPLDQRELDFMRGRFDAAKTILRYPEKAARTLERHNQEESAD